MQTKRRSEPGHAPTMQRKGVHGQHQAHNRPGDDLRAAGWVSVVYPSPTSERSDAPRACPTFGLLVTPSIQRRQETIMGETIDIIATGDSSISIERKGEVLDEIVSDSATIILSGRNDKGDAAVAVSFWRNGFRWSAAATYASENIPMLAVVINGEAGSIRVVAHGALSVSSSMHGVQA